MTPWQVCFRQQVQKSLSLAEHLHRILDKQSLEGWQAQPRIILTHRSFTLAEHLPQNTWPHARQWCCLVKVEKATRHLLQFKLAPVALIRMNVSVSLQTCENVFVYTTLYSFKSVGGYLVT